MSIKGTRHCSVSMALNLFHSLQFFFLSFLFPENKKHTANKETNFASKSIIGWEKLYYYSVQIKSENEMQLMSNVAKATRINNIQHTQYPVIQSNMHNIVLTEFQLIYKNVKSKYTNFLHSNNTHCK